MMFKVICMHSKPLKHATYSEIWRNISYNKDKLLVFSIFPKRCCAPKLKICMHHFLDVFYPPNSLQNPKLNLNSGHFDDFHFLHFVIFMIFVNKTEIAICYGVEGIAHGGCAEPSPRGPSIGGTSRLSSDADDAPSHSPPTEARFKSVAHNKTENNQRTFQTNI